MRRISVAFLFLTVGTTVQAQTFTMGSGRGATVSHPNKSLFEDSNPSRSTNETVPSDRSSAAPVVDAPLPTSGEGNATLVLTVAALALAGTGAGAWTLRRRALR